MIMILGGRVIDFGLGAQRWMDWSESGGFEFITVLTSDVRVRRIGHFGIRRKTGFP